MCLITINDSFRPVFMKLYNRHEDYLIQYITVFSLNVVKKPIVDEGIFSETELGIIGSVLFFTYAIGKFTEGNPMLSGVSWKNFQTINAPINPTIPAPENSLQAIQNCIDMGVDVIEIDLKKTKDLTFT